MQGDVANPHIHSQLTRALEDPYISYPSHIVEKISDLSYFGIPCLWTFLPVHKRFLRFTSATTLANCIVVSMEAEPLYLQTG